MTTTLNKVIRVLTTFIAFVALMSSVLTVVLESSASASGTITEATTFPVSVESSVAPGVTSLTVVSQHVGDLLIFSSQIHSTTITVSSVVSSGSGTTGAWTLAERNVDTTNGVITEEIWWAVVTATGSTTITANYSGDVSALTPELVADSFVPATASGWSVAASNGAAGTSTSTITFPSLTSSAATNQLYWGYAESTQSASAGSSSGFTYTSVPQGNIITSNDSLSSNTPYTPSASATGGNNTSIGAIFADVTAAAADTVTFNSQGGSPTPAPISGPNGTTITLPTPTFPGHTFNGWFLTSSGGSAQPSTYTLSSSLTLFAQWTANATDTFTYAAGTGGTGTAPTGGSGLNGSTITLAANTFTRAGYTFAGWNDGLVATQAAGSTYTLASSPIVLTAQWTANATDTFTYAAGTGGTGTAPTGGSGLNGSTITLAANTFTRAGYTFAGWNDGLVATQAAGSTYTLASSPIVLTAQWTVNGGGGGGGGSPTTYTVTFIANGGTGTMAPETNSASAALTPNSFTRAGYNFAGWNTVAGGGGSAYVNDANYAFTASVTLYAQWTATNAPGAPSGLTTTTGSGSASLVWSAPSGSTILGYNVYEGTSPGGESGTPLNGTTLVAGTSFVATGLNHGVRYYFIVKAVSANGSSIASNETSAISLTKASTHTSLTLSKRTVLYGSQHSVEFIVRVTPRGSNQALNGVVKIRVGSRFVCSARVSGNGVARCALPARALRVGNDRVVAFYLGSSNSNPSTSVVVTLKIA